MRFSLNMKSSNSTIFSKYIKPGTIPKSANGRPKDLYTRDNPASPENYLICGSCTSGYQGQGIKESITQKTKTAMDYMGNELCDLEGHAK